MIMPEFLKEHPAVEKVYYPSLLSHGTSSTIQKIMDSHFGPVTTFKLKSSIEC
jgi:O-acetylhomoserine/O-acetylserine sulfhydrylase-like pyridoxal-dependent enzyme